AWAVEAGLDRDDVSGHEGIAAGDPHAGLLVHLEADAVAQTVEEALLQNLARLLRELGPVPVLLEELARADVDVAPRDAGLDRFEGVVERLPAEPVVLDELTGRLADHVGPGHVRKARRLAVTRPQVDDDRLAGHDPAGAHLVPDRALGTVRDDELVG